MSEIENISGYLHPSYAQSFSEYGTLRKLPACGGWIIERAIPGREERDAMGCYPLFVCQNWKNLPLDLMELEKCTTTSALTALSLVTDPFAGDSIDEDFLRKHFDVVKIFKNHYVADLSRPLDDSVNRHHRYYARRSLRDMEVEVCLEPIKYLAEWTRLYDCLVERHQIQGMRAFSEESFRKQLTTPGMILFVGKRQGEVISAHLVTRHDAVAYSHLAASTPEGYQNSAAYGVYWKTMEYLASQGVHWFNIGAAAGVATSSTYDTGLGSFKHGWTTMSRPVYFCGKVFDALRYAAICRECRVGPTDYFPAYRKNEFDSDDPPAKREEEASSSSGNIRNIIGRVVREKRRLVIWGAADHALVVASAVRAWKEYTVVGFIDSINPERRGESFGGSTILGGREVLEDLRRDGVYHVTFGFGSCSGRLSVGDFLLKEGFEVPVIIHPDAIVAPEATFDVGTFFGPASSVSIECRIGRFVIINDGAVICHHAQLGDGVHICPGVVLAGRVNVGRGTWVGISACVRDHISIGADSYIGTGSVVVKDIPDGVLAYGNPARVIRKITEPF